MGNEKKYVIIRNQASGLVLDATDYVVKMQHYNGNNSQLWKLKSTGIGTYLIENKHNDKVLDIQGGAQNGNKLITYQKHGNVNQQWFVNSDKTIVSAALGNLAIDVNTGSLSAGAELIAYPKHGNQNQQFWLQ